MCLSNTAATGLPSHVSPISYRTARRIVQAHHYLGYAPPGCKVCLGVYTENELIGVMIFGRPVARKEDQDNTLELTRMFLFDSPKNSESRALSLAEKWIQQNRNEKRLIAYCDTAQGHTGAIYKAANWMLVSKGRKGMNYRNGRRVIVSLPKLKFERILSPTCLICMKKLSKSQGGYRIEGHPVHRKCMIDYTEWETETKNPGITTEQSRQIQLKRNLEHLYRNIEGNKNG